MMAEDRAQLLQDVLTERYGPLRSNERELTLPVPAPVRPEPVALGAVRLSQARLERLEQRLREQGCAVLPLRDTA